jgi:DNA polymerase elongation subunit (family B)
MKFYTNVFVRGGKVYCRGYDMGVRTQEVVQYEPYLFVSSPNGKYKTIDGRRAAIKNFDSIYEAKDFIKKHEDIENFEFFGLTNFAYTYIYDTYKGEIDFDPSMVNVVTIDIEVAADDGFPSIDDASKPITAIALRSKGQTAVLGCGDFKSNDSKVHYLKCKDEFDLLEKFLQVWQSDAWMPDILTGWNTEFFDIPYLVNRINRLLGEKAVKKLSPWGIVQKREIIRGKSVARGGKQIADRVDTVYELYGISSLDYLELYKKFSFSNQESYKLDYIAQVELGEKKVDYSEHGSLLELYKNDFQKFIEYNIQDTALVDKLDDKLKLIEQVMTIAYDAKVNYNDTMTTVKPWDVIIHNYLLDQGIVIPQQTRNKMNTHLVGGYVKDPKKGMHKWVVSFDLNSLYPHLIMQYNISPETMVARATSFPSIDELLSGEHNFKSDDPNEQGFSWTANGCAYRKGYQGFFPALMEKMYNDRAMYKKKMLEAKKSYEKTKSKEDSKLVARYHNMQLAKKIQLNSAYGALGNEYFRWFSFNNAEAITTSGQLTIRWIERKMNEFMNKMLKTDEDYIIASDTDSIYITFEKLVEKLDDKSDLELVRIIDEFVNAKVQPYMDQCFNELAEMMNAYQQKMFMKRETIANKGIWKAKKMYILNAWNVEGVQYDEPKLKIQGIEAVRSSTPYACRENIKKALTIIMNKEESDLKKFIEEFRLQFNSMSFEQVAFPRGVNGLSDYESSSHIYIKGTPIHVKGALLFNNMLKSKRIKNIQPIMNKDKVKFAYLKMPNPVKDSVIAAPDSLPPEFKLDAYIDRDTQFDKSFLEPIRSITEVINWNIDNKSTLEEFFA